MISKSTLSTLILAVALLSSCVSSKKYKAATADAAAAKATADSLSRRTSELQSQLNDAIASSKMIAEERDRYQKEAEAAKKQLEGYQSALDAYTGSMDELQKKVADRLADYADRGVSVVNKDGLVAVNIDDNLLFNGNRISKQGETVLGTLASVLNENPDIRITVLGHTDDRAAGATDTWSASTERANRVVRSLKTMKINPARLTSAGQAHYNPIADNTTAEGRAQNRRTEIVLSPAAFKPLTREGR